MRALKRLVARLRNSATNRHSDERLQEEIQTHIAMLTEENTRCGMSSASLPQYCTESIAHFFTAGSFVALLRPVNAYVNSIKSSGLLGSSLTRSCTIGIISGARFDS